MNLTELVPTRTPESERKSDSETITSFNDNDSAYSEKTLNDTMSEKDQYAHLLKQIMEKEADDPHFALRLDGIICSLIISAENSIDDEKDQNENESKQMESKIKYVQNCSWQRAKSIIDKKVKTDLSNEFGAKYEENAIKIMLKICIKMLKMRKELIDYPMIFVPLSISFQEYQPKFMSKQRILKDTLSKPQAGDQISNRERKARFQHRRNGSTLVSLPQLDNSTQPTSSYQNELKKCLEWTESFLFMETPSVYKYDLMADDIKTFKCEGCQTVIKLREMSNNEEIKKYVVGKGNNKKTFLFCTLQCEQLRKYKEAIRQYAAEYEFKKERESTLFAMKDNALDVDMWRNAQISDNKNLRRERGLALLSLWKEYSSQQNIESEDDIPQILRYCDVITFGRPLWCFCVGQLSTKDRVPLWNILNFLATELPTAMAINLLRSTRESLVRFNVQNLDKVCLKIIASSTHSIATALYLAAFMQSNQKRDSSRSAAFIEISSKYINIATHLLSQIESDHLIAILLETPSNIDDLSILDIVIRFKLESFLEFHRLQPIFMNMWIEYKYLDPSKPFRNRDADYLDILSLCYSHPALFYYSPVGAFTLQATMYTFHVILVSIVTAQLLYPYKEITFFEWIVWIFNACFVLYEVIELFIRRWSYFQYWSNIIGFIMSLIWVILALIRYVTFYHFLDYYCNLDECESEYLDNEIQCLNGVIIGDAPCLRDAVVTKVYMVFWSVQLVLLWCRMIALLQRNKHCGPLLRMIMNMMTEIASFGLVLFLFMVGSVLAVYYIVGHDIGQNEEIHGLDTISTVFLYHIQALLAAQEWSIIASNENIEQNHIDSERSIMVETCMVLFSIVGNLLLMNLFIALLTITFESVKQHARLKTKFARVTHTIELNNKSAVMPPPLNILVFALTMLYEVFELILFLLSCGHWSTNLSFLYPIKYSLHVQLKQKEKETKEKQNRRGSILWKSKTRLDTNTRLSINGHEDGGQHQKVSLLDDSSDSEEKETNLYHPSAQIYNSHCSEDDDESSNNQWCGCFVKSDETFSEQWISLKNAEYCRHCRNSLSLNEPKSKSDIDRYFDLFEFSHLLDEDDKKLLRLRSSNNTCPYCFRSFSAQKTKRGLSRFQVILEILSYYVFKVLIWWWLLVILSIPALIGMIGKRLNHNYYNDQMAGYDEQIMTNVHRNDGEYRGNVQRVIQKYDKEKAEDSDEFDMHKLMDVMKAVQLELNQIRNKK